MPTNRRIILGSLAGAGLAMTQPTASSAAGGYRVRRLVDRPIIAPGMDERMGSNIEGLR